MKRLLELYLTSWALLLSHAAVFCLGAAAMFMALVSVLERQGVLTPAQVAAMWP